MMLVCRNFGTRHAYTARIYGTTPGAINPPTHINGGNRLMTVPTFSPVENGGRERHWLPGQL